MLPAKHFKINCKLSIVRRLNFPESDCQVQGYASLRLVSQISMKVFEKVLERFEDNERLQKILKTAQA